MADDSKQEPLLKPVRARGRALRRTGAQLDALTSAGALEALADEAKEDWRENAPKPFRTLLDSEPES